MDIEYLEEYRKQFETPIESDNVYEEKLLNNVRLHYLYNVDDVITNAKITNSILKSNDSPMTKIMMFTYLNGHGPCLASRDGADYFIGMKKTLYPRYEDMLKLNSKFLNDFNLISTPGIAFLNFSDGKTYLNQRWRIKSFGQIEFESASFDELYNHLIEFRKYFIMCKDKPPIAVLHILPHYNLNDNDFSNVHYEYSLSFRGC